MSTHSSRRHGSKKVWPYYISGYPLKKRSWLSAFDLKRSGTQKYIREVRLLILTPKIFNRNEPQVKATSPLMNHGSRPLRHGYSVGRAGRRRGTLCMAGVREEGISKLSHSNAVGPESDG